MDATGSLQEQVRTVIAELQKVRARDEEKMDVDAPHTVFLVLDATIGQNALSPPAEFTRVAGVHPAAS